MSIERGVTVEGLTITYMPRGPGVGNADSIQQRARWFGYKADYLGYCRVYLSSEMHDVYRAYVTHDEHMRETLRHAQEDHIPLRNWRRAFFLSPALHPTRHSVIGYMRGNCEPGWFWPRRVHWLDEALEANRRTVKEFLSHISFANAQWTDNATEHQTHEVARGVSLDFLYEHLLLQFRITNPDDSLKFHGMLLQVGAHLDAHPDEVATVYRIRPSVTTNRTLTPSGQINELFQGRSSAGADSYPGDRAFREDSGVTVQIHHVNVNRRDGKLSLRGCPCCSCVDS